MKFFSKIKKAIVGALMSVMLLILGAAISACGSNDSQNSVPELFGFDVGQTIRVDRHSLVVPTNVHVTDADGTIYDVIVTVRDSNGNVIATDEGNKFNAYDENGYTITYSIETWYFTVTKTVKVEVRKVEAALEFDMECATLVSVGDTVSVEVTGNMTDPDFDLSVTCKATGEKCPVEGLTFQTTEVGEHVVTLTVEADEGSETKEMLIYSRKPTQEGEVETFGEDWRTVREYSPKYVAEEGTWTMATTAETGIKNIEGQDDTYAVLETDAEYTHIYFNIRESRAYYRDLAMKGYTHVRFRIYVDSPTNRAKLFNWEHNSSNSWRTSLGNAKAGDWTEFYIPLASGVAGTSDKKPGFIESYEYYQSTWILLLDNSTGDWNKNGREVDEEGNPLTFKIYFDDVFAVRKTYETTMSTTETNDVYDLASLLERAWGTKTSDYTYSIVKHTANGEQKKLVDNESLTSKDVDISELKNNESAYGSYELLYFIKGGSLDIPYRRIWLNVLNKAFDDFGVSARGMIWRYQDATASVRANADGDMTYTTAGSWGAGLQISPSHDIAYYKAKHTAGYMLSFDLTMNVSYFGQAQTTVLNICPFKLFDNTDVVEMQDGDTKTITISLQNIVNHYKELQNTALYPDKTADEDWYGKYVLFYIAYVGSKPDNLEKITFTVSNLVLKA